MALRPAHPSPGHGEPGRTRLSGPGGKPFAPIRCPLILTLGALSPLAWGGPGDDHPGGYFITPPSYGHARPEEAHGGWLAPDADAPSPPSHSYTATDNIQDPPPPFVYLVGRKRRDLAGVHRFQQEDQILDTWLRFYPRNLKFALKQGSGTPRWPAIQSMRLYTRGGLPYKQWDTLPGSQHPVLQVVSEGRVVNRADGAIADFRPVGPSVVDLFIGDDGSIASRHIPLELEIVTLDGTLRCAVQRRSLHDNRAD